MKSAMSWINETPKRIMVDMMFTDVDPYILSELDPNQIVDQIVKTGAQVVYLWFKDENGYAYYPSQVGPMHPNLYGFNFSGTMTRLLKDKGIRVIAYYIVGLDLYYARSNPDQRIHFNDDQQGFIPFPCLTNQYQNYTLTQLAEIVREYDIDGIWLDCVFYPQRAFFPGSEADKSGNDAVVSACYCSACREEFRQATGLDVPEPGEIGTNRWRAWVEHRQNRLLDYLEKVQAIKVMRPGLSLTHNYLVFEQHDWKGGLSWRSSSYADWLTAEAYYDWMGYLHTSLLPRLMKATGEGKPFEILTLSYSRLWDWTIKPMDQLLAEAMTIVAHGGALVIDDHVSPSGRVEPKMYDRIRGIFDQVDRVIPYAKDGDSIPYCAVVYSERTRDLYAYGKPRAYQSSFEGACRTLLEAGLPFDVVVDEKLTTEMLQKYRVIVCSNVACLSAETSRVIDQAVKQGVGLVATYATGLYDEDGIQREDFSLHSVGVHYSAFPEYPNIFYQFEDEEALEFTRNVETGLPFNLNKPYIQVRGTPRSAGRIRHPIIWGCNHHYRDYENPPGQLTSHPAVWWQQAEGRTVYFPVDLGAAYAEYTLPQAKHLLANAIRWAGGEAPAWVEAPACVEAIFLRQKGRWVIHLVNFPSAPLRSLLIGGRVQSVPVVERIPVVSDLIVHMSSAVANRVKQVSSLQSGRLEWREGQNHIRLPKLHIHDAIIVDLIEE